MYTRKGESLKSGEDDSLGRRVWKVLLEQENILVFNTEHLKTSKGFQEPSYFLSPPPEISVLVLNT